MKRDPTSIDDYKRIGRELTKLHYDTMRLGTEISRRFGKTKFNLFSSNKEMLKLRSDIEARMFAEHPVGYNDLSDDEVYDIFYGGGEEK